VRSHLRHLGVIFEAGVERSRATPATIATIDVLAGVAGVAGVIGR